MDIKLMPAQASVLIDANIFIYHLGGVSVECTDFLRRVALGEFEAHVTTIVMAEVLHRRMLGEAVGKGIVSQGQALKKLKADSTLITQLTDYITDVETILELPLTVIEVTTSDIQTSHSLRRSHGLFVNDSINLACAQRLGIEDIATRDNDFLRVPGMKVWMPEDI